MTLHFLPSHPIKTLISYCNISSLPSSLPTTPNTHLRHTKLSTDNTGELDTLDTLIEGHGGKEGLLPIPRSAIKIQQHLHAFQ